jgi:hypothetical protein
MRVERCSEVSMGVSVVGSKMCRQDGGRRCVVRASRHRGDCRRVVGSVLEYI